jgi:hypothetical protein
METALIGTNCPGDDYCEVSESAATTAGQDCSLPHFPTTAHERSAMEPVRPLIQETLFV